mgnify:CR=1 FL=1
MIFLQKYDEIINRQNKISKEEEKKLLTAKETLEKLTKKAAKDKMKKEQETFKEYAKKISLTQTKNNQAIKIYRPYVRYSNKNKSNPKVYWNLVYIRTNKSLKNTIYSDDVNQNIFDDIDNFMFNEEWYQNRGIPYKRGYLLHGHPGTGKTSVSKIIAS